MKVTVTFQIEPDPDQADPEHPTGLTNEAFEEISDAVQDLGATNINIHKG